MRNTVVRRAAWILALAGMLGVAWWADRERPRDALERDSQLIVVTSGADRGAGSLREAVFDALRSRTQPRILLRVERITLLEPLPPATHEIGFSIVSRMHTVIDASSVTADAVLELHAPFVELRGFSIEKASQAAVLLRGNHALLDDVGISDADVGVTLSAEVAHIEVRGSRFDRNRIAIQGGAVGGVITDSHFGANSGNALRFVASDGAAEDQRPLTIRGNRFERDTDAIAIANRAVTIEDNHIIDAAHDAIGIVNGTASIRGNLIRGTHNVGLLLGGNARIEVSRNEVARGAGTGILLQSDVEARVARNRVYGNETGIVQIAGTLRRPPLLSDNEVFEQRADGIRIVGGSPMLRGNRAIRNGGAGLRVLDSTAADGQPLRARPLLDSNVTIGNAADGVVRTAQAM